MAYVPVPKDLNAVKTKVLFNLTKRQLCLPRQRRSGGRAAVLPAPAEPFQQRSGDLHDRGHAPFFLSALYEKNGLPLEKIIKNIVQVCFIRPKVRPYETDNFYAVLQRQDILDKEVYRIVSGKNKVKPRRQKAD